MSQRDEIFEINDIAVLEVLNNPTRLRIVSEMESPSSVRDVAERLGVPVTRLYYHVNLLEEVGVIEVAETRKVGAMIERLYQAVAGQFRPGPRIFEGEDVGRLAKVAAGTVLDGAILDAEEGLRRHFQALAAGKERSDAYPGTISRSILKISTARAGEFAEQLEDLIAKWRVEIEEASGGDDVEDYGLSVVFFPMVSPMRGARER